MEAALKALAIILALIVRAVKTHDADERQAHIDYARSNPADYLRGFGRVRELDSGDNESEPDAVRSGQADDQHSSR